MGRVRLPTKGPLYRWRQRGEQQTALLGKGSKPTCKEDRLPDPCAQDFSNYLNLFAEASKKIESNPKGLTGEASSNTYTAEGVWIRGHRE